MKTTILILLHIITAIVIFCQCKNEPVQSFEHYKISINADLDSLITKFSKNISQNDSASIFIILKNLDARSLKIYLVAKKPLRSDFNFIGIPLMTFQKNGKNVYLYTGLEKTIKQDTNFFDVHIEIHDDRLKQMTSLYETPIIKKELHILEDNKLKKLDIFDEMIFVGNPRDSIKFR